MAVIMVIIMLMVMIMVIMETTPPGLLPRIWEPEPSVRELLTAPLASMMLPEPKFRMERDVLTRSR